MAANSTQIIVVAQAEGDALQQGVVVEEHPAAEHAGGEATHEGTEVAGEHHETGVFPPFDASTFASQLLWLAITFGFLYVLISRAAVPRIGGILEQRKTRIDGDLREADRLRQETDRAIAAYEAALSEARQRAHGIAEETRASIKADIDGKRAAVEAQLAQKLSVGEAAIRSGKAKALANVEDIAAQTVVALIARLTGKVTPAVAKKAVAAAAKG